MIPRPWTNRLLIVTGALMAVGGSLLVLAGHRDASVLWVLVGVFAGPAATQRRRPVAIAVTGAIAGVAAYACAAFPGAHPWKSLSVWCAIATLALYGFALVLRRPQGAHDGDLREAAVEQRIGPDERHPG